MEDISLLEAVVVVFGLLMATAGAVNTIGSAVEKLLKAWKAAKAPNDTQNKRLDALEKRMETADKKFANDNDRLNSLEQGNHATQRAILALLGHGLHGNNVKQMEEAEDELKSYLINR